MGSCEDEKCLSAAASATGNHGVIECVTVNGRSTATGRTHRAAEASRDLRRDDVVWNAREQSDNCTCTPLRLLRK